MCENTVFKKTKKGDILAAFFVLFCAVLLFIAFFGKTQGDVVYIKYGDVTERYFLHEDRKLNIENSGVHSVITIENGSVFVSESDCASGVCVKTGKISSGSIVCAPGGIIITVGEGDSDVIAG